MKQQYPKVLLSKICRPRQWKTISQNELLTDGFPVYGANGRIGFYSEYNHEQPTILITCRGATCGTINICEPKSYVTGNAMALDELDLNKIDLKYLYHHLKSRGFADVISGSAQPQITRQGLEKVSIVVPQISEQRRIAAILDKADTLRRKRTETLKLLDQFLRSVFLEMFGDPVRNEKRWNTKPLGELIDSNRGISYGIVQRGENVNKGVPVIRISNFTDNKFDSSSLVYTSPEISSSYRRTVLRGGELVISIRGTVGRIAVVPDSAKGSNVSREVAVIPLLNNVSRTLVNHTLLSSGVQQLILGNVKGVAQSGINLSDLRRVPIPMPTTKIISQFEEIVQAIDHLEQKFIHARVEDESLFGSVSQCAFRGEL